MATFAHVCAVVAVVARWAQRTGSSEGDDSCQQILPFPTLVESTIRSNVVVAAIVLWNTIYLGRTVYLLLRFRRIFDHKRAAATYALRSRERIPYLRTNRQSRSLSVFRPLRCVFPE
jgi:hypothetical protein